MKNKLNIAFCFVGEIRTPPVINKFYKKIENDYDFFMSTWDDEDSRKLDFKFIECIKHNVEKHMSYFWTITPQQVLDKHNNKLKNCKGHTSVVPAAFHIETVISLVKKYEKKKNFKYDVIVLGRPDYIVPLDLFKREISRFAIQSNIDRPIISIQAPLTFKHHVSPEGLVDDFITINRDMIFLLNNKALNGAMNLKRDLFLERKDLDIKFAWRGMHELFAFVILYNNYISIVNEIRGEVAVGRHHNYPGEQGYEADSDFGSHYWREEFK